MKLKQQQQQPKYQDGTPSVEETKENWRQQISAAKSLWGKITENELIKIDGHQHKLAALIQKRYDISSTKAEKQVKDFFNDFF